MTSEERTQRRAHLDAFFARASGRSGHGLAEYVQRLRAEHQVSIESDGTYTGCVCRDVMCSKDLLLAWADELVVSYEGKVQDLASETSRNARMLDRIRSLHVEWRGGGLLLPEHADVPGRCINCKQQWPCDTITVALAESLESR